MDVIGQLQREPGAFDFLQAVRLLERFSVRNASCRMLGHSVPPAEEGVRFRTDISLGFTNERITRVTPPEGQADATGVWQLTTSLLSLAGANGVLPYPYAEWLQASVKNREPALLEFLERFQHRTLSLYYRALAKYRLPLTYEKAAMAKGCQASADRPRLCPSELIGALSGQFGSAPGTSTRAFFSAFYAPSGRSAMALEKILSFYFELPVRVVDFIGEWQALDKTARSQLRARGACEPGNNCLGRTALLGKKAWLTQQRVRVELGPLNARQLRLFSAPGEARAALEHLTKGFLGEFCAIEFKLVVARHCLASRAQLVGCSGARLGRDTLLASHHGLQTRATSLAELSFRSTYT